MSKVNKNIPTNIYLSIEIYPYKYIYYVALLHICTSGNVFTFSRFLQLNPLVKLHQIRQALYQMNVFGDTAKVFRCCDHDSRLGYRDRIAVFLNDVRFMGQVHCYIATGHHVHLIQLLPMLTPG